MSSYSKEYRHFNHAYEYWTGKKWEWKDEEGNQRHPMEVGDEATRAFYVGFSMAVKGQKEIREKVKKLERIEDEFKTLKKYFTKL